MHMTFPGINFWWQAAGGRSFSPVCLVQCHFYGIRVTGTILHLKCTKGRLLVWCDPGLYRGFAGWMLLANPLPDIGTRGIPTFGFYVLAFLFPVYIILCILLALDAILRRTNRALFG